MTLFFLKHVPRMFLMHIFCFSKRNFANTNARFEWSDNFYEEKTSDSAILPLLKNQVFSGAGIKKNRENREKIFCFEAANFK